MMWLNSIKLGAINMQNVIRIYLHYNYIMVEFVGGNLKALFEGKDEQEAKERYDEYLAWLKSAGRKEIEI